MMKSVSIVYSLCMISSFSHAFSPSSKNACTIRTPTSALRATAETEAERLRQRARELMAEVKQAEDALHSNLIEKKKYQDAATDAIISELFPPNEEGGTCDLARRLRNKRLAADTLVKIVERLHEREIAARGLEHIEPSVRNEGVTFERVAEPNEKELEAVQGLMDRLIEAADVLDREFVNQKSECDSRMTHSDIVHWGGGNIAGILKDKAKELGREHDEQFRKRLESFYDAAKRKHSRDEVDSTGWKDGDAWNP
ncbi:hypothetical protein HJC23_009396 [Cyclotella cryptica]|uniref:Uncharacterized protein n=1 Tax=Cyclotella cryptica TaxID=29204 RepID=A0ABD3PWY2_9STRA|eukprot:CCRYP_010585-RA/>CCRYP_010585-RA protein AED:0.26 eAED:0.26 QI:0/-1/0/1/-1/1/1/0/254